MQFLIGALVGIALFILLTVMIRAGLSTKQKLDKGESGGWGTEMGRKEIWNMWKYDNPDTTLEACVAKHPSNCFTSTVTSGTFPCPACEEAADPVMFTYSLDTDDTDLIEIVKLANDYMLAPNKTCLNHGGSSMFTVFLLRLTDISPEDTVDVDGTSHATIEAAKRMILSMFNLTNYDDVPEAFKEAIEFIKSTHTTDDEPPVSTDYVDTDKLANLYKAVTGLTLADCKTALMA